MATNTSLITHVTGQAWVRGSDGSLTALRQGMRVPAGTDIVTADGASVQLQADGLPPVTIGAGQDVQLGADMFQPDVDPASAAAASPSDADVARVARALEAGTDPFADLDPTAAVVQGGSGSDGGSSFTRLAAVVETTTPLGLEYPRPVVLTPEEVRFGGTGNNRAPELVDQGVSGTGLLDQLNDDSDEITPINVGMHFTDPDGNALTFTATGLPPGLVLDPITGIISGTLDSSASQGGTNGNGVYNVVITATDPYGASTSLTFNWGVNNPPPAADDDTATTEENTIVTGNVLRGEPGTGAGRDNDPDGDTLVVTEITNTEGARVPAGSPITGVNTDDGKGGGTFVIHPDGRYTFTPGSDFDYLADGESTTTTVTYQISDGDGGFDTATLTITVTGSNDAPRIDAGGTDDAATITEIEDGKTGENTVTHEKTGVIKFADADDSDTHTFVVVPNQPDYLGELTLVDNGDRTLGWSFKVDDKAIDYLAVGQTLTQEYEVTVTDENGTQARQTITITIVGTNDAPIIDETGSDTTGAVTEDAADPTTQGTLAWGDDDTRDDHTWTVTQPGQYGELIINNEGEWVYTLDSRKADHLPAGEKITDTITVQVDDGNGGTDTQEIVITITGTNDVPVIEDTTVDAGLVKEAGYQEAGIPDVTGQLVASDVDDNAQLTWSLKDTDNNDALTLQGVYGLITLNAQTGAWTYTLHNDADITQKLNVGDTKTEIFNAYVSDGQGGVVNRPITVTVEGTNDAPVAVADDNTVVEAGVAIGGNEALTGAKAQATGNVLDNDTDVDEGDKATLAVDGFYLGTDTSGAANAAGSTVTGTYGSLVLNANGTYTYTLADGSTQVQALKAGATETETFTYIVMDEHGAPHSNTLTITITGTNDVPTITSALEAAQGVVTEAGHNADGTENPGVATATGTLTSHDVDADATASWKIQGTANGTYGTIAIDPNTGKWVYTLDNARAATQALKNGQTETDTFTARVQDEHGAWADQVITVTVQGTNDAPTATGENVTLAEDPTEGLAANAKMGNVLANDQNHEGDNLVIKQFTIESNQGDGVLIVYQPGDTVSFANGIGTFVLQANGDYIFTPKPNYSGPVPKITYTVQEPNDSGEDGLTVTADLQFTVTPVADEPGLADPADTLTPEDHAIDLGLTAPVGKDTVDHNGATGDGDRPELLGPITLNGIPAGAQLLDADGKLLHTATGDPITIVLSNPDAGNEHIAGASGTLHLTKGQFESLKINPAAHDGDNITVPVSVDSYEVDNAGNLLPGIPSANTTVDVTVDVQAVTDTVTLAFKDGVSGTFTMDEDTRFDLTAQLEAAFQDLDGSEQRDIVIGGLPSGSSVFVNGNAITVGSDGSFTVQATGQTGNIGSFPKIEIRPPAHFSGNMNDITVTLNAQDTDGDSTHTTTVESDHVTLNLQVGAIAGDVSVGGVTGKEDTAIKFLANVKLVDLDGSEVFTKLVIKGVPADWVVKDAAGNVVHPDGDGNYALPATSLGTDAAGNLTAYKDWTVTPPAHSSKDATFTLNIETTDVDPVTGELSVVNQDYGLNVTVTPVAEVVGGRSDPDGVDDLTMTGGHTYSGVAGTEDAWFALNVSGNGTSAGFNLKDGWSNQDGKLPSGGNADSADGGTEQTYALLTPELVVKGLDSDSANGAQFRYTDANNQTVVLTYNGTPVQIPMEFLHTVEFLPPPHVSGEFKINVQAKTVDTDPDGGTHEAISGNAVLDGIFIAPVADHVTLAVGGVDGRAQGDEDTAIGLSIRPTSSDPSETFNVTIRDIPAGSVLTYGGLVLTVTGGAVTIPDFNSSTSLTITPPVNSNEDFTLQVDAVSVDTVGGVTHVSTSSTQDLHVRVDGVADTAEVILEQDVSYTEAALDGSDNTISLSDLISHAALTDADDSETLSFKITGLPDGFTVQGATFIGGDGNSREWVFTQDQLDSVLIQVPEHYSGKLPGELVAITTENDGDSLTGAPVKWDVDITPSPESDMTTRSTIVEDTPSKVDFSIANNHGDTNETLTAVWIQVADVKGADFTLFMGNQTFAEAGVAIVTKDDVDYYELRGADIHNVYAQAGENFASNQAAANPVFSIKYEITDVAKDDSQTPVAQEKAGQHELVVTAVTDPVALTLGDMTGTGVSSHAPGSVILTSTGDLGVDIVLTKLPDAAAGNQPDYDGSEQFTQVVISGVPNGMVVDGLKVGDHPLGNVSFLGDGTWVISIPQDQYPKFTGDITGSVQFSTGSHLGSSLNEHPISITVVTQDSGATGTATDSEILLVSTDFTGGGNPEPTVDVTFTQNPDFVGTEDTSFKLSEAFTGTVNGSGTHFTVVLTLPPGAQVSSGGQALTPTLIDGQEVWVISGHGDQAVLDAFLDSILVTPPANLNDNIGGFDIDATFAAHLDNGSQDQAKLEDVVVPLTPVTDPAVIEVGFWAADDSGAPTEEPAQEGSDVAITLNVTSPLDGATTLGDKLYVKLQEGGGLSGGTLKDADGNPLTQYTVAENEVPGLAAGDYYVLDLGANATAPYAVNLIYTPAENQAFQDGTLAVDAWVQNQELGAANTTLGGGGATGELLGVNNGYDITVGTEGEPGNWVVTGPENQNGGESGRIQLDVGGTGLIDTDSSETAFVALLKNLPAGFLVYVGNDAASAKLAGNAGVDANGNNVWNIPLDANGMLPAYISVQPPQNWSGTLDGVHLSVLSGEQGQDTRDTTVAEFDLVVEAKADGILSFSPAPAFGLEGHIIQLNLNMVMADGKPAGSTDQSHETITLTLKGLGEHAAFYVGSGLDDLLGSDRVTYDGDTDTYTVSGLSQADADKLGFIQAAGAAQGEVNVEAWTVESEGGDSSELAKKTGSFDLSIFDDPATGGHDTLLYDGGLLDGGAGDDTIWLRLGEDVDFDDIRDDSGRGFMNIETIDLTREGFDHELSNLSAEDVLDMTDSGNILTIKGDAGDTLLLAGDDWALDTEQSTEDRAVYIAKAQQGSQEIDVSVAVEGADFAAKLASSLIDQGKTGTEG